MGINKYHALYLASYPMIELLREKKISFDSSVAPEQLRNVINESIEKGTIPEEELNDLLYEWMYQGRKKILFRFVDSNEIKNYKNLAYFEQFADENFHVSDRMKGIENLNISNEKEHLVEIRIYLNSEDEQEIDQVVFVYVKMLRYWDRRVPFEFAATIPYPVFVNVDFINNEISCRVNAKANVYTLDGRSIEDVDIAQEYLDHILLKLNMKPYVQEHNISKLEKAFYKLHEFATELPAAIMQKATEFDDDVRLFIDTVKQKIDNNSELYKDEMYNSIMDVIIKQIIRTCDDKEIFSDGKDVISTGVNASGSSLSKLNYKSPGQDPVQSTPEYQNIRSVLSETERIAKNTLYWKSERKSKNRVRSKCFVKSDGYGVVSFEEYVYEEDIQHVFSEIRSFKQDTGIY